MLNQTESLYYQKREENFYYFYEKNGCAEVPKNRGGRKQVKPGTTKRNARERNRVKYINNCFEVLREHIPYELIVDDNNKTNGNQRKLSKVETLKYASLYIRQLTELLEQSNENQNLQNFYQDDNNCIKRFKKEYTNDPYSFTSTNYNILNNLNNNNDCGYNQFTPSGSSLSSNEYVYSPTSSSSSSSYSFY
ncbi:unnamed protein product [Brachionus calyciflorus]|uniref:BHLH domain-containing protein n=1 Tax=Brachionus calyciflorus TaxID=104777 RepID=A0A813XMH3_9BILA|nr:unnamed protein product [Brachionus calyciflorus]